MKLDSKIPEGHIEKKWSNHRFHMKLVNPANKRKYSIIVVGTGLAGASAAGVAFFPIDKSGDCTSSGVSAHGVFAVIFFVCIFYVCIAMSRKSLNEITDSARREGFRYTYLWCSGIMLGSIALAVLSRFLPKDYIQALCENSAIFWFEAVGVWAFSAFWYIKTRELDPSLSWIPLRKKHET